MLHVFVDADACPVKPEICRVAGRYRLQVTLVANSWMRTPDDSWISLEVVTRGADAADDWIAERVEPHDIVITGGPPPLKQRDRSQFLQQLDEAIQTIRREHPANIPRTS